MLRNRHYQCFLLPSEPGCNLEKATRRGRTARFFRAKSAPAPLSLPPSPRIPTMVGPASGEKTPIPTPAPSPPLPDPRPHPDEPSPDESPAKKAKVASDDALDLDLIDLEKPVQDPATPYSDVDGSQVPTADEDDAQIVFSNPVAIKGIDYRAKMIRAIAADSSGAHGACDRSGAPLVERVEQPSWADEVAGKAGAWFVSEGRESNLPDSKDRQSEFPDFFFRQSRASASCGTSSAL